MLLPILQAAGQQVVLFVTSPAFSQILNSLMKVPTPIYGVTLQQVSKLPERYEALDPEIKEKINSAALWVAKDLAGDIAEAATGLPIGQLVDPIFDKVFGENGQENNSSPVELNLRQPGVFQMSRGQIK